MRKPQNQQALAGSERKRPMFGLLALCLVLVFGIAVSLAFLGSRLGPFSGRDANVIQLLPPEEIFLSAGENTATVPSSSEAERKPVETPHAPPAAAPSPRSLGRTSYTKAQPSRAELLVFDNLQVWNSETQAALFRSGYDDTVQSANGDKVIAPGTSNFYGFSVKNNGNVTMDYTVSLKVDTYLGEGDTYSSLPIEWRLLSGDGAVICDWQEYNERTAALKHSTLAVRKQERYTIEWRWQFDRDESMDEADTSMGNIAENQPIGVNATIYIFAEQTDPSEVPNTGDSFHVALYLVPMAVSMCGLLILIGTKKRGKNRGE